MNVKPLKIVIIGPESTGKSTLCSQLAAHYDTLWCPEYAREYLLTNGKEYTYEALLQIAEGQLKLEDEYVDRVSRQWALGAARSTHRPLLFIDTDMYVMKVWCEFVFGNCHAFILDQIVERSYDQYLLTHTDLPWEKDALREYPDLETRERLFHMYRDLLINQSVPWSSVYGTDAERLSRAIEAVDALLKADQSKSSTVPQHAYIPDQKP